jgi:hypothetical protein
MLVLLTVFGLVRWLVGDSPLLFVVLLVADAALTYSMQKRLDALFLAAERAAESLHLTAELIAQWEAESFGADWLRERRGAFLRENGSASGHRGASEALARLAQLAELMGHRRNYMIRILDAPLLYSMQLAGAVQGWLRAHGEHVGAWMEALGQLEAMASFATYSYEHPRDPFPELVEGEACFEARGLGHPLIAEAKCVRNDVALSRETKLLMVRIEYVGQEHAVARGGCEYCAGDGGSNGARGEPEAHSALCGRKHSGERFAAGGAFAFLCGDPSAARDLCTRRAAAACVVSAG